MKKQKQKEIKILLWLASLFILVGLFQTQGIWQAQAVEAPPERYTYLPQNADRELTRIEKRRVVADKIRYLAEQRDFKWIDYLVNLSCCESLLEMKENNLGNYPECTVDRGWFGINSYWHREVTDEQARDLVWSTNWTMDMIENGQQGQWMCDKKVKGFPDYSKIHCEI